MGMYTNEKAIKALEGHVAALQLLVTQPHARLMALEEALTKQRMANAALLAEFEKIMGDAAPSKTYKNVLMALRETL